MELQDLLMMGAVLTVGLVALLIGWAFIVRRRLRRLDPSFSSSDPVVDVKMEPGELKASIVSERIEDIAQKIMADHPSLSDVDLDFETAADGSLRIWVDGDLYHTVEAIPDGRIRQAIAEAVEEFNRPPES
jgi:hypothetical protein